MRRNYFAFASGFLLALSLWSFSDNFLWNVGQPSNSDPKLVVHGLFCMAWMIVLFAQAMLVRGGNIRTHRTLGVAGCIAAVGVTVTTIYVFFVVWKGWDAMAPYLRANRLLLPSYSILVLLGYLNRRRPEWHKRYMLVATLYMLEPVLSRAFDPLDPLLTGFTDAEVDLYWWAFFVVTWLGFFLSLLVYDWRVARRIHPVTIGGFAWFGAIWTIVILT